MRTLSNAYPFDPSVTWPKCRVNVNPWVSHRYHHRHSYPRRRVTTLDVKSYRKQALNNATLANVKNDNTAETGSTGKLTPVIWPGGADLGRAPPDLPESSSFYRALPKRGDRRQNGESLQAPRTFSITAVQLTGNAEIKLSLQTVGLLLTFC